MKSLVVPAPAKVNLFLHITGRRPDGYHLLESLFAYIDLADTVLLTLRDDGEITRPRDLPGIPLAQDLALRAAIALKAASGTRWGADIAVTKRIALGGGLGGGSSDAASVLLALNRLWDVRLPRATLLKIGERLGADVPFFVGGQNALVRGIGEVLTPVSLPRQWLALAQPPAGVSTAQIFAAPNLTRSTPSAKIDVFSAGYGRNDLAEVVAAMVPDVAAAINALAGASPNARVTGSGACVFAAFPTQLEAQRALALLPRNISGQVVRTLARHPLAAFA